MIARMLNVHDASPSAPASVREWPLAERPRERLHAFGAAALSDAELLSVLFGTGRRGESALDAARAALSRAGSLHAMLGQTACLAALGPVRSARLAAALELARRHYGAQLREREALTSPLAARQFLTAQLRDRPYEVFCCLFLDNRHRLLAFAELFRGTIDGASVHPREVIREALTHNAAAVILAHNHPSGIAEPSQADELITHRLRDALALVDMRLLDHLIVAGPATVSLAERGLL